MVESANTHPARSVCRYFKVMMLCSWQDYFMLPHRSDFHLKAGIPQKIKSNLFKVMLWELNVRGITFDYYFGVALRFVVVRRKLQRVSVSCPGMD